MKRIASLAALLTLFVLCAAQAEVVLEPLPREAVLPAASVNFSEPFAPEGLDKVIIGSDDRITADVRQYPYSAIGYMDVHAKCGDTWTGTGFMAGKRLFMTAAHCMYCNEHHAWADNVTIYFGFRSQKNYAYRFTGGWTAWIGTDFPNGYQTENDYSYVLLDQPVGDETGWFGLSFRSASDLKGSWFTVAGYRDGLLKYDRDRVGEVYQTTFRHYADTLPGTSGGPIFDSNLYAVGINVAENRSDAYNVGERLTDDMYESMIDNGIF